MDQLRSHISGRFFFNPVPLYISIIPLVSWGPPAWHWEAYIRPSQDVTATGHSSIRTSPNLNRRSQFLGSSWKQQVWPATCVSVCLRPSSFVRLPPPLSLNMDTSVLVSLLALVVAMAGVTGALHIQGSPNKDDLPGSEEQMADSLMEMVRKEKKSHSLSFH